MLLKKFATQTPASQRRAARGKQPVRGSVRRLPGLLEAVGYFGPQTSAPADQEEGTDGDVVEMMLPLVFAGDDALVEEASMVMDELPSQDEAQKIRKVLARELKQRGLPHEFDIDVWPYRLDLPLDGEDEDEDEEAAIPGLIAENLTFYEQQARQGAIPMVMQALRELDQDETIVAATTALQSLSREQSRPLVTVMDDVCAVVTPDTVYVGFKTVDDLIASAQAEEEDFRHDCSGEELLGYWREWISERYYPLLETLQANDFKMRIFHLPTWSKAMGGSLAGDRVVVGLVPGSGAYPILADMFVEKSRHVSETDMQPQILCVAQEIMRIEGPASDGSEEVFGIAAQCAFTAEGEVAWQNNVFATRPLAVSWCEDFLDTLQQDNGIGKQVDGRLLVCEACMLLAVEPVLAEIHERGKLGKVTGHKVH